jgi:FMN-dependent oxidoreductase (nitrilotriacetate monooxygenase family)
MPGSRNEKMRLGAFLMPTGHHVASWRHPQADADAGINFAHYANLAQTAERAKFDMIFLQDGLAVREAHPEALRRSAQYIANFDPTVLISGLAAVTSRIGLVATGSTSYNEPFNIARRFASLDHLSGGRAGWNIVTSTQPAEAKNFGREVHFEHGERYERAHEFTRIVTGLWDSWDDDAFPRNKVTGEFLVPEKLHLLNHRGKYFSVRGPLNVPRAPQGWPVLVQAGVSDDARRFAAEFAEVIFSSHLTKQQSKTYYEAVKAHVTEFGRAPSDIKIMPGLNPIVGHTSAEADEKLEFLNSLIEPIVAREILSTFIGVDLSVYNFDDPFPDVQPTARSSGSFHNWVGLAKQEGLTLRQLAFRAARGRMSVIKGSPQQIADHMEDWFLDNACDGFNIMPPYLPGAFDDFVELVVPELQRRGLFRTEYEGRTFRDHLGLKRPASRYQARELASAH